MTVFENIIKEKSIDEIADWLDKNVWSDETPWLRWWDDNYCKKCMAELKGLKEYGWCELNGNCKFFQDKEDVPSMKEIIKMWLESEAE